MSHMVAVPDELYTRLAALAGEQGKPIERVVAGLLARELERTAAELAPTAHRLDWQTASAEEIIADLRASRVEREHPIEL